jgi:FtsH-binding integral membrane protein
MLVDSPILTNIYCCFGVLLFGVYLVIDTQMIVGGKSVEIAIDEYAIAAMLLYIDIIQIFMYILNLLSNKE